MAGQATGRVCATRASMRRSDAENAWRGGLGADAMRPAPAKPLCVELRGWGSRIGSAHGECDDGLLGTGRCTCSDGYVGISGFFGDGISNRM